MAEKTNYKRYPGNNNGKHHSNENYEQKIPPHSIDSEIAVLGSMMLDRSAVSKVQEIITADSFYSEINKIIFETAVELNENGHTPDITTLSKELHKKDLLEFVGGTYYLTEINAKIPTAANAEYHAHIVQENYLKRELIKTAGTILMNAYDNSTDALEEIDKAESSIFAIAEKRVRKSYVDLNQLAHEALNKITEQKNRDMNTLTGVPSGYTDLDSKTGGFQNSDLIIIAGRPSMGKTALALSLARNAASVYKKKIALFSIEMSALQLVIRLISAEAKIDQQKIRTGDLNHEDMQKIIRTLGRLAKSHIIIDDSPMISVMELRAKCRRLKAEYGIEMVIIDYLQLMHPPKAESREREISIISRSLKQLAKELDIPVVALAQLNRSVESRSDKRPMLSDLRESGSIEQDADVVCFVNRPEQYGIMAYDDKSPTEGTAELIIGKQRNGPTGTARLAYIKDYARFENLELHYEEPPEYLDNPVEDEPGF